MSTRIPFPVAHLDTQAIDCHQPPQTSCFQSERMDHDLMETAICYRVQILIKQYMNQNKISHQVIRVLEL